MDNYWSNIQLPEEQDNINAYLLKLLLTVSGLQCKEFQSHHFVLKTNKSLNK